MHIFFSFIYCKILVTYDLSLLQNVPPALLVQFLREHRSEWADYNIDSYSAASLKAGSYAFLGLRPTRFSGNQIIMPLAHTVEKEEVCFTPNYFVVIYVHLIWTWTRVGAGNGNDVPNICVCEHIVITTIVIILAFFHQFGYY